MIQRIFTNIGAGKFLLLWVFTLLFGISGRIEGGSTIQLHLLSVLNDHYYFIFAVLPIFLLLCIGVIEDDASELVIRYGTYCRYFFAKWLALAFWAAVLWLGQMVILLLCGLGLPSGIGWAAAEGGVWRDVFTLLQAFFVCPEIAAVCCAGQLLIGYWLIGLTALWLGHFCQRSSSIRLLMGFYVLSILWIKLPILSRPPFVFLTGFNHWILLLHNLTEPWRPFLTAAVTVVLAAVQCWSVRRAWRWPVPSLRNRRGLSPYYRRLLFSGSNMVLPTGIVLLLAGLAWLRGGSPADGTEWVVRLFAGHGTGQFYPLGLLALLVIDLFPLWPLGVLGTQVTEDCSAFLTIRLKRKTEMMSALLSATAQWLLFYGGLLIAAAILPPLVLGMPLNIGLTAIAVGLKLLDVGAQFLLILLILCLTRQIVYGFLAVTLIHFLCVLPIPYFPVGLSSLTRLYLSQTGGTVPPVYAALVLAGLSAAILIWLYRPGVKKLFNHEGGYKWNQLLQ